MLMLICLKREVKKNIFNLNTSNVNVNRTIVEKIAKELNLNTSNVNVNPILYRIRS